MTDLISRADAIAYIDRVIKSGLGRYKSLDYIRKYISALPSAEAVHGFRGGKIPPKEMLDGTVLIQKHQWIEMERELAELKEKFESADAVQGEWDSNQACSICGCQPWYEHDIHTLHYCPNCGARMKGGDSE